MLAYPYRNKPYLCSANMLKKAPYVVKKNCDALGSQLNSNLVMSIDFLLMPFLVAHRDTGTRRKRHYVKSSPDNSSPNNSYPK